MYRAFYGLRERPFDLTVSAKYFLMTRGHQEALSNLQVGLSTGTGITLLLGEAGTGKTSVLRKAIGPGYTASFSRFSVVCVSNSTLNTTDFLDTLAHGFRLSPEARASKSQFLRELEGRLLEQRAMGHTCALVVDEAQSLPDALLEEIRLLANFEADEERLLKIVLAGQPSLAQRLNQPGLRQLKQRIDLRCVLPPLDLEETARYIARRIEVAGGTPLSTFSRDAVLMIYKRSGGIPRTINVIGANALLTGFAAGQRPVGANTVLEVCADFDLHEERPTPVPIPEGGGQIRVIDRAPAWRPAFPFLSFPAFSRRGARRP